MLEHDRSTEHDRSEENKVDDRYCPHCQKECNIKTYKEHKRLFFSPDTMSWYIPSTFEQTAAENDLEGLSGSLANEEMEDHDSSFESEVENFDSSLFGDDNELKALSRFFNFQPNIHFRYLRVMNLNCCESHMLTFTLKELLFFLDECNQIPTTCKRYNHIQFSSVKLSSACESYHGEVQ